MVWDRHFSIPERRHLNRQQSINHTKGTGDALKRGIRKADIRVEAIAAMLKTIGMSIKLTKSQPLANDPHKFGKQSNCEGVLLRPKQTNLAASVVDYCTGVLRVSHVLLCSPEQHKNA